MKIRETNWNLKVTCFESEIIVALTSFNSGKFLYFRASFQGNESEKFS